MDGWGVLDMIASSIIDLLEVRLEARLLWRRLRGDILRVGWGGRGFFLAICLVFRLKIRAVSRWVHWHFGTLDTSD
jgi:hypothetical protein